MMKLALKDHVVQMGHLEKDVQEVINLIKGYELPADFFEWLTKNAYTKKIIQESVHDNKHTRIVQYGVGLVPLFTGRVEFELDKFSQDAIKFIVNDKRPLLDDNSRFLNIRIHRFSQTSTELHYTVVSKLYKQDEVVGSGWEIFELPGLVELYNKMEDPLRHWRSDYS